MAELLLKIKGLSVWLSDLKQNSNQPFSRDKHLLGIRGFPLLDDVSLSIKPGEVVGLAGESGSGKTTLALSILRLAPGYIDSQSEIEFLGENLIALPEKILQQRIRGRGIGMIFQDARASLNPVRPIGRQIMDVLKHHKICSNKESRMQAGYLLTKVGIPLDRFGDYPYQLSGGEAQRIAIAKAIASRPKLLLADEPTTGLDLITQKKIVDLILALKDEFHMSVLFISHSLLLLASGICDRIAVLHQGRVVEEGLAKSVFENPKHEFTKALKASIPKISIRESIKYS